jgi:molybdopterin-synthase adenylyltransferase
VSSRAGSALIVGVGGLGCPASLALAHAGLARLTLVDPDRVEPSNLHRQLWHTASDLGRFKVDSAADKLRAAFSDLEVNVHRERLVDTNAAALCEGQDVVVDGTDDSGAKFLLSDLATALGMPVVYAGVVQLSGQVMVIRPGGPCLRCLFEAPPDPDAQATCANAGVMGSIAGWVGGVQGLAAARLLRERTWAKASMTTLQVLDGATLRQRALTIPKLPGCLGCGGQAAAQPPEGPR